MTREEMNNWTRVQHMAAARKANAARLALVMAKMKPRQGQVELKLKPKK